MTLIASKHLNNFRFDYNRRRVIELKVGFFGGRCGLDSGDASHSRGRSGHLIVPYLRRKPSPAHIRRTLIPHGSTSSMR